MKTLVIDKNSWHYRLLNDLEYSKLQRTKDFCGYFWLLTKTLIPFVLMAFIICLFEVALPLGAYLNHKSWEMIAFPWLLTIGTISISITVGIICDFFENLKEKRRQRKYKEKYERDSVKKESLLKIKMRSIKEKTCYLVEFK